MTLFPIDDGEPYFLYNGSLVARNRFSVDMVSGKPIIYEVLMVRNSAPLFLNDHLQRLNVSIRKLAFAYSGLSAMVRAVNRILDVKPVARKNLRITLVQRERGTVDCVIYFIPSRYPDSESYRKGVALSVFRALRPNPTIKQENFQLRSEANSIINGKCCFEVALVNHDSRITEGSRSNLFFIRGGSVITAPDELVLGGITRKKVLEICNHLNIPVSYTAPMLKDIGAFDAVFLTGTSIGVLPVVEFDGISFQSAENPLLHAISLRYSNLVKESIREWKRRVKSG